MVEKLIFTKMNKDVSSKDMRDGEYRHAENLVAVSDGVGTSVRLENMRGMEQVGMPVPVGSVNIGIWNYKEGNKIYGFYSGSTDSIIEYDGVLKQGVVLMQNNILDFQIGRPVYDVFFIDDLLYFNDGLHLRKINITFAKTGALNDVIDERALSLIKTPPLETLVVQRKTDPSSPKEDSDKDIRITPYQFAERYVYNDDEISVLSPISVVAPAMDYEINPDDFNAIDITLSIDIALTPLIKRVELLVRKGNDGSWQLYQKFDPIIFVTPGRGANFRQTTYTFYGNKSGSILPETETGTSAESVSRRSKAMTLMVDRLFATSSLEEYDIATADWDAIINIVSEKTPEDDLNDAVYFPKYFKDDSQYTMGVLYFDEFGRKSAPEVKDLMTKQFPKLFSSYSINGLIRYHHQDTWRARIGLSGKPPIWAKKYQIARTASQSYNSWVKLRMVAKPVFATNKSEDPPSLLASTVYLEGDTWYFDVNKVLRDKLSTSPATEAGSLFTPKYIDLVIPDQLPIPIDEKSIIRLAFDYPHNEVWDTNPNERIQEFQIIRIQEGRIRITGLGDWFHWGQVFYDEASLIRGISFVKQNGDGFLKNLVEINSKYDDDRRCVMNDETFIHFEILNPIKETENPLMYEIGKVYDVEDAGTDARAFQPDSSHDDIEGDSYYAAYNSNNAIAPTDREDRVMKTISYPSLTPIADIQRTGSPLSIDEEGNAVSIPEETGLYWSTAHDSKGRVTVQVPDQKELLRGNQVRFSRTFIQDSKVNGLSNFPEENKYALDSDRGDIVRLIPASENVLVAIHTRSITSLYIKKRFITTGENTDFLTTTSSIIGDDKKLALDLGSQHPESIVENGGRVYGFDSIMSEPWRRSQDGITPLATAYGMKTYFEKRGQEIRTIRTVDPSAVIQIVGAYDPWLDMYIITFSEIEYTNLAGDLVKTIPETIGFSERVKAWVSFYSFKPEYYSTIMNNLVSAKDQSLWIHTETTSRNLFYGVFEKSTITVIANDRNDKPKIYQNLMISSNKKWTMTCITPEGKDSLLNLDNFIERDGVFYADILRDKNTDSALLQPNQTPLLHGEKMIGEVLELTFENEDSDKVTLDAIYVGYSPMVGHLLSQE